MSVEEMNNIEEEEISQDISLLAFRGKYPLSTIYDGIETQFNDYINIEDKVNYVDRFYDQLSFSYQDVLDEFNNDLLIEALNNIRDEFVSFMNNLFNKRFTICIRSIESEDYNQEEIEFIFRKLYEVFVLNARKNFVKVISQDIHSKMNPNIMNDDKYFSFIETMLESYSPLILEIGPMEFLRYVDDNEVFELFNSNKVNGNFLRKYSPKLYQNEDLKVEIINEITLQNVFMEG